MENRSRRRLIKLSFWGVGLALLFALYTSGIRNNPPGFYMDESAPCYNAYLVAHTGAGEFGPKFPLYFQYYGETWTQIGGPVQVYMLALLFLFFPPSILLARLFSAFWVFTAGLLLGLLAKQISGRRTIGVIVALTALLTPWFFEGRGLLLEPQFLPMALAPFLLALYHVQKKDRWSFLDATMLAAALALVTYCYTSGRVLAPLLAIGLFCFVTSKGRLVDVIKTGVLYGLTLIPIFIYNKHNPGALTKRLNEISYIRPGVPLRDILPQFVRRYMEDQSLTPLLTVGDVYPRHHVPGSGGAIFFGTFILVLIGLAVVLGRRWKDPWWRFILYGALVSIVPGAMSNWAFHSMRLMAYPVFLTVLTVPGLEWLLARQDKQALNQEPLPAGANAASVSTGSVPRAVRLLMLLLLLGLTCGEAYRFQKVFRRDGPSRTFHFDVPYKAAYEMATKQPIRPIYLEDGKWGPGYIHALWFATIEKRPKSEFVHLSAGSKPPPGKVVISSHEQCEHCETIARLGVYHIYKTL